MLFSAHSLTLRSRLRLRTAFASDNLPCWRYTEPRLLRDIAFLGATILADRNSPIVAGKTGDMPKRVLRKQSRSAGPIQLPAYTYLPQLLVLCRCPVS